MCWTNSRSTSSAWMSCRRSVSEGRRRNRRGTRQFRYDGSACRGTMKYRFVFHFGSADTKMQFLLIPVYFMPKRAVRVCFSLGRSAREPWKRSGRPGWRSCWWRGRSRKHGLNSRGKRRKKHEKMQHGRGPGNFAVISLVPFTVTFPSKLHLLYNSSTSWLVRLRILKSSINKDSLWMAWKKISGESS